MRSDNTEKVATNGLISLRKKRVSLRRIHADMPDASSAHAHEKKLKVKDTPVIPPAFFDFTLITSISDKHHYYHLSAQESIRKPHPLLTALAGNIPDAKALYDTVKTDPELVAKIINVSNSPLFGLSKPILNVNHAIVYLGLVQVKNIATHFALQKSMPFSDALQQQTYQQIWATSFLASSITLIICKAMDLENAAELSTRCQLSYLGDIATLFSNPETALLYSENSSYFERMKYIQDLTKANNAILSGILVKKWNLPKDISDGLHYSALPFTDQLLETETGLNEEEVQEILICYCCCRLAESIIFEKSYETIKSEAFSFEVTGIEEFYYMPKLLEAFNLTKLDEVLARSSIKVKLIQTK